MDVEQAKEAMKVGVNAANRNMMYQQQMQAQMAAQQQRAAIQRRNQQIQMAQQQRQNYWSRLGVGVPYMC